MAKISNSNIDRAITKGMEDMACKGKGKGKGKGGSKGSGGGKKSKLKETAMPCNGID